MRIHHRWRVALVCGGIPLLLIALAGASGIKVDKWDASPAVAYGIIAFLMIGIGATGAVPEANIREGTMKWPEVDLLNRLDEIEKGLTALTATVATQQVDFTEERYVVDERLIQVTQDVQDVALAMRPHPDEGLSEEEIEEARLANEEAENDLSHEISSMQYSGEGYNDGMSIGQLQSALESGRAAEARADRIRDAHRRVQDEALIRPIPRSLREQFRLDRTTQRITEAMDDHDLD